MFFNPEQYVDFDNEPSNIQLRLPIIHCGLSILHRDYVYQRNLRMYGRAEMDRRALEAVQAFRPDVVVYSATWEHENLSPSTLAAIRAGGTAVVSMLWDSWIEPTTAEAELLANSDVLVTGDSLHTYLRCRLTGEDLTPKTKVAFAAGQVFTDLIHPLPDEAAMYDVTLLGSREGVRGALIAYLEEALPKHGVRFNKAGGLVDSRKGTFRLSDNWVSWTDYVRIINRSRICLSSQTDPTRLQIKGKIFDYMACGIACLTDDNPETQCFIPSDAAIRFSDPKECVDRILHLLRDDAERTRVAAAGQTWLAKTFDYRRFWAGVLMAAIANAEIPTLPTLEREFDAVRTRRHLILRQQMTVAQRLVSLTFGASEGERLAVSWLGRTGRFHRLALDGGQSGTRFAALDRLPVDFVEISGTLCAVSEPLGVLTLAMGRTVAPHGTHTILLADTLDRLDQAIAQESL